MTNVAPPIASMLVCVEEEVLLIPADTQQDDNGKSLFSPVSFENKF